MGGNFKILIEHIWSSGTQGVTDFLLNSFLLKSDVMSLYPLWNGKVRV